MRAVFVSIRNRRSLWSGAAAACAGLALAACGAGPAYKLPAVQAPPAYKENAAAGSRQWKTANPSDGVLRGNWWEMFDDPQLNKLEQMVTVSNQNVKRAEASFREARSLVALNRANYLPSLGSQPAITSSFASSNAGPQRPGGGTVTSLLSMPFSVSWEPDFWGRLRLALANATANAQASAADLENMKLSMQAELASDYFQMEAIDMEQKLLKDTIGAYEKALKLTESRFNNGVASKADVAQAQAQLSSTRAQLTDLGVSRAQLEHAIAVLAGQPPSAFSLPAGEIRSAPPNIPAGLPSQLLERRPDIAASERLVAAANAQIGLAKVAFYPTLSLAANGGAEGSSFANWLTWPSRFWSLGPNMTATLLDFGRRKAGEQQAGAAYDATVASYRQTVLGAFQEVEDNLAALRLLAEEAVQQDDAVKAAEESLRLELDRYKGGTASYLDVITAQTIALTNERSAVQILGRRMTAAVQLIAALGGGWDSSQLPSDQALRAAAKGKSAGSTAAQALK
jgi:NodT family efflux transporter outer membrane factor (OMF) lipoprotein